MMYTKGVRKIFSPKIGQGGLEACQKIAEAARFDALEFNGQIFVLEEDRDRDPRIIHPWVKSCFNIDDFAAVHELG